MNIQETSSMGARTPNVLNANQSNREDSHENNNTQLPVLLDRETLDLLLSELSPHAGQAIRMLTKIGLEPDSETNKINKLGGVNLSQVAKRINPKIRKHGFYIKCRQPPAPIIGTFGEDSGQQLWGVYLLNDAPSGDD